MTDQCLNQGLHTAYSGDYCLSRAIKARTKKSKVFFKVDLNSEHILEGRFHCSLKRPVGHHWDDETIVDR